MYVLCAMHSLSLPLVLFVYIQIPHQCLAYIHMLTIGEVSSDLGSSVYGTHPNRDLPDSTPMTAVLPRENRTACAGGHEASISFAPIRLQVEHELVASKVQEHAASVSNTALGRPRPNWKVHA